MNNRCGMTTKSRYDSVVSESVDQAVKRKRISRHPYLQDREKFSHPRALGYK